MSPKEPPAQPRLATSRPLRQRLPDQAFVALTVLALVLCYFVARPFISSLAWATALAVVGAPLHRWIEHRFRWPSLAATCSLVLLAIVLVAVTGLLIPRIVNEAYAGFVELRARTEAGQWDQALARHPWIGPVWEWFGARLDLNDAINRAAALLASAGSLAVRWSFLATIEIAMTFFFLFYFLRDRAALLAGLRGLLPTSPAETDRLFDATEATLFATVYGKVLIGIIQGFLGGLMFWWLDISAPWFWAIVMGVLSIAPLIGAPIVWIPAALLLGLQGQWGQAILLALWGAIVVGLADNVLYPMVVGRYLRLHTVLLLIAMIGGLFIFGPAGFFLGPVLLALTATMLAIWRERASTPATSGEAESGARE